MLASARSRLASVPRHAVRPFSRSRGDVSSLRLPEHARAGEVIASATRFGAVGTTSLAIVRIAPVRGSGPTARLVADRLPAAIERYSRATDVRIRLDPHRFVVLLHGCNRDGARRFLARLRYGLAQELSISEQDIERAIALHAMEHNPGRHHHAADFLQDAIAGADVVGPDPRPRGDGFDVRRSALGLATPDHPRDE